MYHAVDDSTMWSHLLESCIEAAVSPPYSCGTICATGIKVVIQPVFTEVIIKVLQNVESCCRCVQIT